MRNYKRLAWLLAVLALTGLLGGVSAQTREEREQLRKMAEEQNWPTKVFEIKHAEVNPLTALLMGVFRGEFRGEPALKAIAVRAPKEIMPAIEDTIKRLDVPPPPRPTSKNIELTAYLVVASEQAETSGALPSELQPVVKQLKSVFSYQGFRLLDTLVLRSREGAGGEMSGIAPNMKGEGASAAPTIYQLKFSSARIASDEKGRVIWINGLRLGTRVPVSTGSGFNYHDIGMAADVDVREGQKVVVGKSSIGGPDRTLFMVVTAKVTD